MGVFTKPNQKGDLVRALNALIRSNLNVLAFYDQKLLYSNPGESDLDRVNALKLLHEHHAELLADTIRILGGTPDFSGTRFPLVGWIEIQLRRAKFGVSPVETARKNRQPQDLEEESYFMESIDPDRESVVAINQALDECKDASRWLRRSAAEDLFATAL